MGLEKVIFSNKAEKSLNLLVDVLYNQNYFGFKKDA